MIVLGVNIHVVPDRVQEFIEATLDNAVNTRKEPGNVRFDVLQAEDDPARFYLYEAYREKDDIAAHQRTAHYLRWRERVQEWMAEPRQRVTYQVVSFTDETA